MVSLLEGISRAQTRDQDPERVPDELLSSPLAQGRLPAILEELFLSSDAGDNRLGGAGTIEFLELLAEAIESRDLFMRGHARRVAFYADLLAAGLNLSRTERNQVRMAGFLHDIGKVGAPSDLLAGAVMPEPQRLESIRTHPTLGESLLLPLGFDATITKTVRHHHERFDGSGYPDGLFGEAIPLSARIVGITDAFDAMTCDRPYRRARTHVEALIELRREGGGQFDPRLVGFFCELVAAGATDALGEAGPLSGDEPNAGDPFEAIYPVSRSTDSRGAA
jgi:putative nucleotidyltransferase with HDIG domain